MTSLDQQLDCCVRVALPLAGQTLCFDYLVPESLTIFTGLGVVVPFGRSQRVGFIVECDIKPADDIELKSIAYVLKDRVVSEPWLRWIQWVSDYYHWPLGQTLKVALPRLIWDSHSEWVPAMSYRITQLGKIKKHLKSISEVQKSVLDYLAECNDWVTESVVFSHGGQQRSLDSLVKKGWVEIQLSEDKVFEYNELVRLTPAQQEIVSKLITQKNYQAILLEGVTGSGKTAVYCAWAREVIAQGRQVLVLIPEIGLTAQTVERFQTSCQGQVAVWHSQLSAQAQYTLWHRIHSGKIDLVIGTRSAVFLSFPALGAIIIDEAHDSSFKQMSSLRYHATDIAMVRAKQQDFPILLGSATPSLVDLQRVETKKMHAVFLHDRVGGGQLPTIKLVDMRAQKIAKGFSAPLLAQLKKHVQAGDQVLIFLNRRGYAPVVMCHACGWGAECQACSVPLTYHAHVAQLHCHHCGYQTARMSMCPVCERPDLSEVGLGTQRVEESLRAYFPDVNIARIDRDTMTTHQVMSKTFAKIKSGEIQVLIGTQMIAKGHHWPHLKFVAMVDADSQLYSSDVFALEHLAQTVWQVAGRAGRTGVGSVMIQTHQPAHPLWAHLLSKGYRGAAQWLLKERKTHSVPPFVPTALLRVKSKHKERLERFWERWSACVITIEALGCEVLGPYPERMARKGGYEQHWVWLRCADRMRLHQAIRTGVVFLSSERTPVQWLFELDPIELG